MNKHGGSKNSVGDLCVNFSEKRATKLAEHLTDTLQDYIGHFVY